MRHEAMIALCAVAISAEAVAGGQGLTPAPTTTFAASAISSATAGGGGASATSAGQSGYYKGYSYSYGFGAPSFANGAQCPMGQFPVIGGTYGWKECSVLFRAQWLAENVGKPTAIRYLCSEGMMEEQECLRAGYAPKSAEGPACISLSQC